MGTMQDAIRDHLEEIKAVAVVNTNVASQTQTVFNGEILASAAEQPVSPAPAPAEDIDEDGVADIIRARTAKRLQFVADRDPRDAELQQRHERSGKSEANLRNLLSEKREVEQLLREETSKLSEAKKAGFATRDLALLQTGIEELTEGLAFITTVKNALEGKYPEIKAKLDEEQRLVILHQWFLERFAKETGGDGVVRYVAKGTPTPNTANVKDMDAFLKKGIEEGENLEIIVSVSKGESAAFVAHDGSRWNPRYPEMMEGLRICKELDAYESAIQSVEQKNLQNCADNYIAAGLLLTPAQITAQKKSPQNRHNLVNMLRFGEGFCFVLIDSKRPADLLSYNVVRPEMKVEYGDNKEGNKKHMLRVTSITAPQFVKNFFFPEAAGDKSVMPTFYFDDLHEIATWRKINLVIRDSLINGIRWAESWEKQAGVMEELGDVSRVSNLKTLDQLGDGVSGTAVIRAPKSWYSDYASDIGFEIVSDGKTVRPGSLATDWSKKLEVYEEIIDGKPVAKFFARAKDGSFQNERLQKLARRNEQFELSWIMPAAVAEHGAESLSADNAAGMVMLTDAGGRNGAYVFKVSVREDRKEKEVDIYRQVAYVVRREDDKLIFVAGLTHYSTHRLTEGGFTLNTPYVLSELRGFVLYILRKVSHKVLDVPYDKLPDHLKGIRETTQNGTHAAQDPASLREEQ